MKKINLTLLRIIAITSIIMSMAIPVMAQESVPEATPSAIVVRSVNANSASFEIVFLIQATIFLVILTLLLNGNVQKYMSFKWHNSK